MITEDYISFEVAKLLKKKGFDGECDLFGRTDEPELIIREAYKIAYEQGIDDECVIIPTHQMAMKWLREVHGIDISIDLRFRSEDEDVYIKSWRYTVYHTDEIEDFGDSDTYEEACESAINYCLENLV